MVSDVVQSSKRAGFDYSLMSSCWYGRTTTATLNVSCLPLPRYKPSKGIGTVVRRLLTSKSSIDHSCSSGESCRLLVLFSGVPRSICGTGCAAYKMEQVRPSRVQQIWQVYLDNRSEQTREMAQRRAAEIMTSYSDLESEVERHFAKALTAARARSSADSQHDGVRTGCSSGSSPPHPPPLSHPPLTHPGPDPSTQPLPSLFPPPPPGLPPPTIVFPEFINYTVEPDLSPSCDLHTFPAAWSESHDHPPSAWLEGEASEDSSGSECPSASYSDYSSPDSITSVQSSYSYQYHTYGYQQPSEGATWGEDATDLDGIQLDWSEQELRELKNMFLLENYS